MSFGASNPAIPASGRYSVASVLAHGIETRYVRTGVGRTVLLPHPPGEDLDREIEYLGGELSQRFRLIVPTVPAAPQTAAAGYGAWLRGLLDGIGINEAVVILVEPSLAGPVIELARLEPDRLPGVAIIGDDPGVPAGPGRVLHLPRPADAESAATLCRAVAGLFPGDNPLA